MVQEEVISVQRLYKIIIGILVFLLVVLIFAGHRFWVNSLGSLDPQCNEAVTVEIERGCSRTDISKILEDRGVIKSAFVFNYYTRFKSNKTFLQGTYELSPAMSVDEILGEIQK